jgi:hypothetical protein
VVRNGLPGGDTPLPVELLGLSSSSNFFGKVIVQFRHCSGALPPPEVGPSVGLLGDDGGVSDGDGSRGEDEPRYDVVLGLGIGLLMGVFVVVLDLP